MNHLKMFKIDIHHFPSVSDDDYVLQNEFYCAQTNDNVINKSVHIKTEPCE